MFGLFKKKSPIRKLEIKHRKLLEEAFELSKSNRSVSDAKIVEAAAVMREIEILQSQSQGE